MEHPKNGTHRYREEIIVNDGQRLLKDGDGSEDGPSPPDNTLSNKGSRSLELSKRVDMTLKEIEL